MTKNKEMKFGWINANEFVPESQDDPSMSNNFRPCTRYLIYQKRFGVVTAVYVDNLWRETFNSVITDEVLYWSHIPQPKSKRIKKHE